MGTLTIYQAPGDGSGGRGDNLYAALSYLLISNPFSVFPTIVIRLIRYSRNTRTAMGAVATGGLRKTIVLILVPSCR